MSEPVFWVGNLNPSITQTILNEDGTAHDLTGQTVRFRMRALGSTTLKVDQPATIVNAPGTDGKVRYDWTGTDTNTAGTYLVWWQVTTTVGGKTQDVQEAVITILPHGVTPPLYVEVEALKEMRDISGNFADDAIRSACFAATRGIELALRRRFWLDPDATSVRTYTPGHLRILQIDDLVALTSVKIDRTGDTVYEETWTQGTDFVFEPQNAPVDRPARPWEWIECRRLRGRWFPVDVEQSVQVTGQFGWPAVPEEIRYCANLIASKLMRRVREAPFGVVALGGPETGIVMRIAKTDPDVHPILSEYERKVPWL